MLSVLIWLPILAAAIIAILPVSFPNHRIRLTALIFFWNSSCLEPIYPAKI